MLNKVQKMGQDRAAWMLRSVAGQMGAEAAQEQHDRVSDRLSCEYPQLTDQLDEACEDVLAYSHFPITHWRKIRTNNPMENLNSRINRRSRVVGIFPNRGSIKRLLGTVLLEQNEDWMTGRRYMRLDSPGEDSISPEEYLVSADQVHGCETILTPH